MPILFHDFETRSTLDLKRIGAHRYAKHPITGVWCCIYAVDDDEVKLWTPDDPLPREFVEAATNPEWITSAHNDQFERLITTHIMAPRYGWPIVPIERRRCSMAMALAMALPGKLEKVAEALNLTNRKDVAGHKLMLRMSKPRKPRVGEDPAGIYWLDDPERLERLYAYCKQDVEVERELHHRLRALIPEEQLRWQSDAAVNDRGFHVDRELAETMVKIADEARQAIDDELAKITNGAVTGINQNDKLIAWLTDHGCPVDDIQKGTISHAMRRKNLAPEVIRAMELRRAGAHAAAAKPLAFIDRCDKDDRILGAFTYHGASTGRWTSLGIQVQNLKRPDGLKDVSGALAAVSAGDLDRMRQFGEPLAVVGTVVRALITAAPGCRLVAADFSGIESRIAAWLSDETWKTEAWRKFDRTKDPNDEPYLIIGRMLGVPEEKARPIGKVADLAFGFMGGLPGWRKFAAMYGLEEKSDEEIRALQQAWRKAHPNIARLWGQLNRAAIQATKNPGKVMQAGARIAFRHEDGFLFMKLPSGRKLAYPFASLMTTDRGDLAVTFMDIQKGKWGPCRYGHGAYGGLWVENAVSATARDVFAEAMPRLEAAGYPVVFHVHDEIVAEAPIEHGNVEEFERIITEAPPWADGMAIAAKGRNGPRFLKTDAPKAAPSAPQEPPPWEDAASETEQEIPTDAPEPEAEDEAPAEEAPRPNTSAGNGHDRQEYRDNEHNYSGSGHSPHNERETGQKLAEFIYRDIRGEPYLRVVKTSTKQFPQYHQVNGVWVKGAPKGPRIPYRLPELVAAPAEVAVWICEGEKDAESVAALGLIATTNPEGAGKFGPDLAPWFHGKRTAYVLEDNDEAGRKHVIKVADALRDVVTDIKVVSFPDVPEGEDVSYWLDELGHTKAELRERAKHAKAPPPRPSYTLVRASDIVARPLDWLWQGHLLRGSLEMFTGIPGLGKSQGQCQFVACTTTGRAWPDGTNGVPAGNVIMMTAEDCLDQILIPRLMAAGADLDRVLILKKIRKDNKDRMFLLSDDIDELAQAIADVGNVRMVCLDPITAYMGGKLDSHRVTDVRGQLGPLAELAERTDVAFSAITHPPKNASQRAIDHYIGSQAFIAAARIGHLSVEEIEENEHGQRAPTGRVLFTNPKNNPHPKMPTLAYRLEEKDVAPGIKAPVVIWEEIVDLTADQAIAAASPKRDKDRQSGVVTFLLDILANGPVPVKVIEERATTRGFSKDQLDRAKKKMGVVSFKEKVLQGRSFWALPQHAPREGEH
jgi:DNA polymerase bacteriophage-type